MLYHAFIGSLADNAIEIGWVLCFSLLADKGLVERITVLFGVNDAFWVVLSSTYYTARTSMTATLPKLIEKQGLSIESKVVKNHIYLFYLMLLPSAVGSFMFLPNLLLILGVSPADLPFYLPYFQLSILSILIAVPWSIFIPSYLRTRGRSKEATVGTVMTIALVYLIAYFGLTWLPESIYRGIISPILWVFLPIEIVTKLRYYMWLAISRSYRNDLNGVAQLIYAIPTAILTPTLLWLFLHHLQLSFESIFAVGAIIGTVQWLGTEIYFRVKLSKGDLCTQ